jgi:steroid 5-alpha reductase family enzyme
MKGPPIEVRVNNLLLTSTQVTVLRASVSYFLRTLNRPQEDTEFEQLRGAWQQSGRTLEQLLKLNIPK